MSQTTAAPPPLAAPESPVAHRLSLRRWRDPRLWVGLLLVASSVVVGGRLLAAADDTVGVWAVARDLGTGAPLTPDALVVEQVRFADAVTAGRYLPTSRPVPTDAVVARDLTAGELVARASIAAQAGTAFELPVVVGPGGAPEDLRVGDVVDVWVGPQAGSGSDAPARRLLTAVPVVGAARSSGPFGEAATRQVLLGLGDETVGGLGPLLGEMSSG
ncbi:MAG: hypothetical protein M3211_12935, partial [Actinomycetota bacterium]|nr:hypothetical protein [Actinomycetota bacterium]